MTVFTTAFLVIGLRKDPVHPDIQQSL